MPDQSLSFSTTDHVESWLTQLWLMRILLMLNAIHWRNLRQNCVHAKLLLWFWRCWRRSYFLRNGCLAQRLGACVEEWCEPCETYIFWNHVKHIFSETMWRIHFLKAHLSGQPNHCDHRAWSRDLSRRITYFAILTWFRPKGCQSGPKWSIDPNFQPIVLMCPNNHRI